MFPAELTTVFANLLTNAVKGASEDGQIEASADINEGTLQVRVQNTGVAWTSKKPKSGSSPSNQQLRR